jgi:hypothetical protein
MIGEKLCVDKGAIANNPNMEYVVILDHWWREAMAQAAVAIDRKGLSGPGLRTFFRIAELWGLSSDQQMTLLGVSAPSTFYKWKKDTNVTLPKDTLERISYVLGIYKALQILLPSEVAADEWVKRQNTAPTFGGRSALDRMLSGQVADLFVVRQYLDAQRGGWA